MFILIYDKIEVVDYPFEYQFNDQKVYFSN